MTDPGGLPPVYIPEQAGTARSPEGRKLVFFYLPEMALTIKRVLGLRPGQFTYRWAYHPGQRVHVLLLYWPLKEGEDAQAAIAIPEEAGERILDFMAGESEVYLTLEPFAGTLEGSAGEETVRRIVAGLTLHLPHIAFKRR